MRKRFVDELPCETWVTFVSHAVKLCLTRNPANKERLPERKKQVDSYPLFVHSYPYSIQLVYTNKRVNTIQ